MDCGGCPKKLKRCYGYPVSLLVEQESLQMASLKDMRDGQAKEPTPVSYSVGTWELIIFLFRGGMGLVLISTPID